MTRLVLFIFLVGISSAQTHKAGDFLHWNKQTQTTYAMGFIDGILVTPSPSTVIQWGRDAKGKPVRLSENENPQKTVLDWLPGKSVTQIAAIIEKYIRNNPEHWDRALHGEAYNALLKACRLKD